MKILKSIITKIIWIFLIIIVIFNIYNFVSINILHKDLATINGYALLEVVSGSMEPTIKVGDLILIDTKYKEINKKDIITFYDINGSFVTHRVMDFERDSIITKGDANDSIDEAFSKDNVVGVYVTKFSGVGKLMSSFKNPFVMVMILIIGILICFFVSTDKTLKPIDISEEEYMEFKNKKK